MGDKSAISWCTATWNPILGCDRVSAGCERCYAELLSHKLAGMGQQVYEGLTHTPHADGKVHWTGEVRCLPERLGIPLKWKAPRLIFVNSMSDFWHEDVPDDFIAQMFMVMAACPQHVFQILTKRPQRMHSLMCKWADEPADYGYYGWAARNIEMLPDWVKVRIGTLDMATFNLPLENVWLGVSVENQEAAVARIPLLLQTPAAVRFISAEPLLGPLDLTNMKYQAGTDGWLSVLGPPGTRNTAWFLPLLDWIICGGESGPNYRPMDLDWARRIRDQCEQTGVPFFYKQGNGIRSGMNPTLDGVEWHQMPGGLAAPVHL